MLKDEKIFWVLGIVLIGLFLVFTVALKFVDVQPIGPEGSLVGFATLNAKFRDLIGVDKRSFIFSEYLGYCALIVVAAAAVQGLGQWISRKSILGVKPQVILFGMFLVVLLGLYIAFDALAINCRPILENDVLEASYPSSHTLLAVFVFIGGAYELSFSARTRGACALIYSCFSFLAACTVISRTLSGYHWITDILGGALLGTSLVMFYIAAVIHAITKDEE